MKNISLIALGVVICLPIALHTTFAQTALTRTLNARDTAVANKINSQSDKLVSIIESIRDKDGLDLPIVKSRKDILSTTAQIVPHAISKIGASMSGTLIEFTLRDGERFKEGEVIAKFRCVRENAVYLQAQAELNKKLGISDRHHELRNLRENSVHESEVTPEDVDVARGELSIANAIMQDCTMKAPFSGRVADVQVSNNQFLKVGSLMFDALDDSELEVEMVLPSSVLGWMKAGHEMNIHISENNKDISATLDRFGGRVDRVSQTIKAYARLNENSVDLLPGMSGTIAIKYNK